MSASYVFDLKDERILAFYESASRIASGEMPSPRMAIIYPAYGCNLHCIGCEYAPDNSTPRLMDTGRMISLVSELADMGVRAIEFCGGGEPTMHPALQETIAAGRRRDVVFGLLTNGTRLAGELAETVARELSYVRVSLNAATGRTFGRLQEDANEAQFDTILENIKGLIGVKKQIGADVLISIKMLVSELNCHEAAAMVKLASSLGADTVQFKAQRMSDYEITAVSAGEISAEITAAAQKYPSLTVVAALAKVIANKHCWINPLQTVIDADGSVYLCCYFRHRRDTHCIGNINDKPFAAIWHGQRHRDAIDSIVIRECNHFDCRFVRYMDTMEKTVFDKKRQMDFI